MTTATASTPQAAPTILSATSTSKLSEDYTSSQTILLDLESSNSIGVFQDYQGDTEAVAIRSDKQLIHVYRDGQKAGASWNVTELGGTIQASEVVTGQDINGTVQAFFRDDANLYQISLQQNGTWTTPTTLPLCSNLQSVTNPNSGDLIISGVTKEGDLQFVQQSNGIWSATTIDFNKELLGTAPSLIIPQSITGQMNWALGVVLNNTFNVYTGIGTQKASGPDPIQAPSPANQVLLSYYNGQSYMFMFSGTDHALYTSVNTTNNLQTIPNTKSVTGAGLIKSDTQFLQVYSVDPDGNLWVLHQTGWDANNAPVWAPNIPLDTGLLQVSINRVPQDSPNLFGLSDDGTLHFVAKDINSGIWTKAIVNMPLDDDAALKQTYRVTTYRTQLNIVDQFKNPQRNLAVTLSAQTEVAVWVEGQTYHLNASQTATVQTNNMGILTVITPARGLRTPEITVTAESLATSFTFQADGEIHTYMGGSGTLNTLQPLSGPTLQTAQVDGAPLAPAVKNNGDLATSAAQGVQHAMQTKPGPNGKCLLEEAGVVGWALDLRDRNNPRFTRFFTHEEMEAYKQGAFTGVSEALLGDWQNDVIDFFTDVWNGIKAAAIAIEHWVVDTVNKVVSFVAKIGEELVQLAELAIKGIEEVISIVQSIFAAIAAFVEKVIKWLEAFFSWGDMIDTKNALISALKQYGPYLSNVVATQGEKLANNFFANAKTSVGNYFDQLSAQFSQGQNMQSLITNAQATRLQADARPLLAFADGTAVQSSDFSGNVHNNWLLDKLLNAFLGAPDFQAVPDLTAPLQKLGNALSASMTDLETAVNDFWNGIKVLFTDPKDFATVGIADFLQGAKNLVLAVLDLADGIVEAMLETITVVTQYVGELLTIPLEIPLITPLLNLIGIPNVSIADVFCLLAAIPLTLVYKLINGADAKLFPGGVLPTSVTDSDEAGYGDTKQAMVFVSVGLMAVWALMDTCLDAFTEDPIFFLKVLDIIFPTLIQVFTWPTDSQVPFTPIPTQTVGEALNFANWVVGWATIGLNLGLLLVPTIPLSEGKQKTVARYIDPFGITMLTVLGCLNMAAGIASIIENKPDGATIAATILSPIPNVAQPLRLEAVRDSSEEVSLVIKLVLDFFTGEGCAIATAVG